MLSLIPGYFGMVKSRFCVGDTAQDHPRHVFVSGVILLQQPRSFSGHLERAPFRSCEVALSHEMLGMVRLSSWF